MGLVPIGWLCMRWEEQAFFGMRFFLAYAKTLAIGNREGFFVCY